LGGNPNTAYLRGSGAEPAETAGKEEKSSGTHLFAGWAKGTGSDRTTLWLERSKKCIKAGGECRLSTSDLEEDSMPKRRFTSSLIRDLINRLRRVQQRDEMTLEDADALLVGAITLNWQFVKLEGIRKSHRQIKRVWNRILDVMDEIA